jgi:hypothetical protein
MGFHFADMVMMAGRWAESPHLGQCTHTFIQHLMEDIAPDYAWTPLREVMHDHPTWTLAFLTLDVGL